jgi:hypothetical protein
MDQVISQLFKDKKEVLDRVAKHQAIVSLLGFPIAEKCDLIDTKIVLGDEQGKGNNGAAFEVTAKVDGVNKTFVVKRATANLQEISTWTKAQVDAYLTSNNATRSDFRKFQSESMLFSYDNAGPNEKVSVRLPPAKCLTIKNITLNGVTIPQGSYICQDESFSELVIGMMLSNFLTEGKCINFFDQYTMFTCKNNNLGKFVNYIFMEKISGSLRTHDYCLLPQAYHSLPYGNQYDAANSMFVQTIFAIAMYQKHLKMSHNDLHDDNVFVQHVTPETKFNGQYLYDAEYYEYVISTFKSIYIPAIPMIAKIGDFGWSAVYKAPIVMQSYLLENGYNTTTKEGKFPMPNEFKPTYDSRYFSLCFSTLFAKNKTSVGKLVLDCLSFIYGTTIPPSYDDNPEQFLINQLRFANNRPDMVETIPSKTAEETLFGPIYKMYGTKPSRGKIVRIGTL